MSTNRKKLQVKEAFRILTFIFTAILVSSCSQKIVFPTSNVVPAAEVVLEIEENDNNNFEIELEVDNLARPDRLNPPRNTYVVWMVTERNGTINIGNLNVSNNNSSSLETQTPFKPIRIYITAEESQNVEIPSTQVVLDSDEFEVK